MAVVKQPVKEICCQQILIFSRFVLFQKLVFSFKMILIHLVALLEVCCGPLVPYLMLNPKFSIWTLQHLDHTSCSSFFFINVCIMCGIA